MNLKNNLLTVRWTLTFIIGTIWSVFSCQAINPPFVIKHLGDGQSIVQIENQKKRGNRMVCRWKPVIRKTMN